MVWARVMGEARIKGMSARMSGFVFHAEVPIYSPAWLRDSVLLACEGKEAGGMDVSKNFVPWWAGNVIMKR